MYMSTWIIYNKPIQWIYVPCLLIFLAIWTIKKYVLIAILICFRKESNKEKNFIWGL